MVKVATMLQTIPRNAPSRRFEFPKMRGIGFFISQKIPVWQHFLHRNRRLSSPGGVHKVELLNVDIPGLSRGHRELSMSTVKYLDNM